ncbi:MAG: hypothetical protein V3V35_02980 [Dehalococcoidia bacterium]
MTERERYNGQATGPDGPPKVFLPQVVQEEEMEGPAAVRVTVPSLQNFFHKYPRKWTWETWAKRIEYESLTVARSLDAIMWGTIGALLGLAVSGIPGAILDSYAWVVWQPLGAATGAVTGALFAWRRWQDIFSSHEDLL